MLHVLLLVYYEYTIVPVGVGCSMTGSMTGSTPVCTSRSIHSTCLLIEEQLTSTVPVLYVYSTVYSTVYTYTYIVQYRY